jgi:hypothetical protein
LLSPLLSLFRESGVGVAGRNEVVTKLLESSFTGEIAGANPLGFLLAPLIPLPT